ncbi:hypothetical protein [Streptomyces xanthochromogenes]|uniref:Secreted protein n=1 Tax=Streptomyces xanthochromogenes TaxID=67384 RepID=A0ABQ3AVZ7_9ACTN|nr:hypothetical protein [Streptomyces xanthochromogenes]GGY69645.1 hypothetical protein GCM10010326_74890 [Streptomyces xanthochromogenes]
MTRTKKTAIRARSGRLVALGALGLATVTLAATPAFAKGSVDISAQRTAHVGETYRVTGHGIDNAAPYLRACLENRSSAETWQQISCGSGVTAGTEAQDVTQIKAAHTGIVEYRAVVYGLTSPTGRHPVRERTSDTATVSVR